MALGDVHYSARVPLRRFAPSSLTRVSGSWRTRSTGVSQPSPTVGVAESGGPDIAGEVGRGLVGP